jgi:hypothetical protein
MSRRKRYDWSAEVRAAAVHIAGCVGCKHLDPALTLLAWSLTDPAKRPAVRAPRKLSGGRGGWLTVTAGRAT